MPVEFNIMRFNKRNVNHLRGKTGVGHTRDIGEDGLSFISSLKLPVGMLLRITLCLPDMQPERVLARVVRCSPVNEGFLTAVQFFNFNDHRRDKIRNFVAEETKKKYKFLSYI